MREITNKIRGFMIECRSSKQAAEVLITPPTAPTNQPVKEDDMAKPYPTRRNQFREENPNWKGGRSITSHGYVLIRVGKDHPLADVRGYAYEHRLKAWEAGQDINGKHVHHEDEIKDSNAPSNLEALTVAEHRFRHRKLDSNRRMPNEANRVVECACGCGAKFDLYDTSGRPRQYVPGHNPPDSPTADALLSLLAGGVKSRRELIRLSGLGRHAVAVCLSKLKRQGRVMKIGHGEWRLKHG